MASSIPGELIPCAFVWHDPGITPCCKTRLFVAIEFGREIFGLVADDAGYVDAALFGHELVYFRSEHIENAEASRALAAWLLVHDINSELHPLAVDVHSFDRSAFRGRD